MADAFGDELFSVFEDDSTTAAGTKKDKEKEKDKWKGPPGPADKAGKRLDTRLQSEPASSGKNKRDLDVEGTDEPIFGKKPRIEDSINEDLSLADLMPRVKQGEMAFTLWLMKMVTSEKIILTLQCKYFGMQVIWPKETRRDGKEEQKVHQMCSRL